MGLFKKLDLWSVDDGLNKIMSYYYDANEKDNPYWDYYSDQINEMGILAADMLDELYDLRNKICCKLPSKKNKFYEEDDCIRYTQTGIAWFNTAACMLDDTDMAVLLENENIYADLPEQLKEKEKRIRALERLTKEQQMWLYSKVIGFLTRYLE